MLKAMKYANLSDTTFALRLDPGDDVHDSIQGFCAEYNIGNASIQGIGSIESPILAHYSMKTKEFTDKHFEGAYEVTSLSGNVALVGGKPFAHAHITLSDPTMQTYGGHLVKGTCSATLELIVTAYPSHHAKADNEAIGLKIWDLES